jgi:hypothetical protein
MFLIDMPRALLSLVCCAGLYLWMARREMRAGWPDLRRSFYLFLARTAIIRLSGLMAHAKYWRPHMLVLSGSPKSRWYLIELSDAIMHGKGFLTVTSILTNPEISSEKIKDLEQSTRSFLEKKDIPALVKIKKAPELIPSIRELIVDYVLGPLAPNTLVLGETEIEANILPYATLMQTLALIQKNAIIICENSCPAPRTWPGMPDRRIDIWWGRESRNGSLMLTLGHLLKTSPEWGGARLCMHSLVDGEEAQTGTRESLQSLVRKSRMHAEITVHLRKEDSSLFQQIGEHSREADILFLGMRKPGPEESTESYADYYRKLLESIQEYPLTILTMAGEEIDFEDILI